MANRKSMQKKAKASKNASISPIKRSWRIRLRNYFLTGLVVTAPIAITIYVAYWVASFVDDLPTILFPEDTVLSEYWSAAAPPGLGIVSMLISITIIGWLTTNFIGRAIINGSERLLGKLPLVSAVYKTLKQIASSIFSSDGESFDRAVLVEYPLTGSWCMAFVANTTSGEIGHRLGEDEMLSVFVPTTPNPTSGFLLFVKKSAVINLDMSIDDAARTIVSAGLITPDWPTEKPDTPLITDQQGKVKNNRSKTKPARKH